MRKRIIFICAALLAAVAVTAAASGAVSDAVTALTEFSAELSTELASEEILDAAVEEQSDAEEAEEIDLSDDENRFDEIASFIGYDTYENFTLLHKTALFMERSCATKEQFDFVEQMILDGCDVQTVMDIYQFYLTTGEDVGIVREIYDRVWDGEPIENRDAVFESAFNAITDGKCGVLTAEDIEGYLADGLTEEDILDANLLSRKGVLTIQEILDEMKSGVAVDEIAETVYGEAAETQNTNIASYAYMTEDTAENDALSEDEAELSEEQAKTVNELFKSKGYWKAKAGENTDFVLEMAQEKGISEETVLEMMDEGYSELDLINALENEACSVETIDALAESEAAR